MESIEEIGLLNAITVSKDLVLVSGAHRLEAFKRMGRTEIDANILELDELRLRMAEIDENLVRKSLHYIDESDQIAERKKIYEALHPETVQYVAAGKASGKSRRTNEPGSLVQPAAESFAKDTAAKVGVTPRTIEQSVQIAENLTDESKEAAKLLNVTKKEAVALARMSGEEQKEAFDKLETGEIKDIRELAKPMRSSKNRSKDSTQTIQTSNDPLVPSPSLPKSRDKAIQQYVAELKDDSRVFTPEMFVYEYDDYVQRFVRRLERYIQEPYSCLYQELTEDDMERILLLNTSVMDAIRSINKKTKGCKTT